MSGFLRWLWLRARGWPWAAFCGYWHSGAWEVLAVRGGEADVWCPECGRRWTQLVPGASA